MYDSILLPTDGSDGAAKALDHATDAAIAYGADLHIISVVDRRVVLAAETDETDAIREELIDDATAAVEDLSTAAAELDVGVTTAVLEGVPYREILEYADAEAIDLLVVGTHSHTGREKRLNLGSTTERLVKAADRPILVVDIG